MRTSWEQKLYAFWGEVQDLSSAEAVLQWDQETGMPPAGVEGRSLVLGTLASLRHRKLCSPELLEILDEGEAEVQSRGEGEGDFAAHLRHARWIVERARRVPEALAKELAEIQSQGHAAWMEARQRADFAVYQPFLQRMLELKREQASALANGGVPYDALMDEFEPGMTTAELSVLFGDLRQQLVPLVAEAAASGVRVDESPARGDFPPQNQLDLGLALVRAMGFDFEAGRVDLSAHPFCTGFNPGDVRLTWRYERGDFRPAVFGLLHEAGHGLYEQGLPHAWRRKPLGEAVSLCLHESQSRLWENLVGRSRGFWRWALPQLHRHLPATRGVTVEGLWPALHTVRPSLIRVEADEATYNLHVILRFELERALFSAELEVEDLPAAWDEAYEELLGVRAEGVADGVLQDIHWCLGSFGYFPTYTLGTLAASQFFAAAERDLGPVEEAFARGEFAPLRVWLGEKIHRFASRYSAQELLRQVTGEPLTSEPFLRYLRATIAEVYPSRSA